MEFVIEDGRFFKNCVDAIVNLVDEGSFEVNKEGMRLRTMDPSQIAMVDFFLPKTAFKKIEVGDEIGNIGVNLVDLSKVLGRTRAGEKLAVSIEEKESKLVLEFYGESKRSFKLPLIDLGGTPPKEPKVPFDCFIKIKGGTFKEILKDAGLISSHVILEADSNNFIVEAHGDSGDLRVENPKEVLEEIKIQTKARAMFPFEYLDDMTKACPDDAIIEISLKTDAPVRLSYLIGEARLGYYLAPRVESI